MKYFFRLLLLVAAVVAFFAFIGMLIPRSYDFGSEIEIAAPTDQVFPKINSLPSWQDWSMQFNTDVIESLEIKYNGESEGVGSAQSWTDPRGDGKLWITESNLDQGIKYKVVFANFPEMDSQIELKPSGENGENTTVVWNSKGKLPGGAFYGYTGWLFPIHMTYEYEKSLEKLKKFVEAEE